MRYGEMRLLEKTHVVRGVLESYRPKSILDWQLLGSVVFSAADYAKA
jgi:hypothetical protein